MSLYDAFNLNNKLPDTTEAPDLSAYMSNHAEVQAGSNLPSLAEMLAHFMQAGTVTNPVWLKDPESTRSVVMIPIDITTLNPALSQQLQDLMETNKQRAPR